MKIFILFGASFPYGMAATSRVICYAKGILLSGVNCEVVISGPTEKITKKTKNKNALDEYEGIKYIYPLGKTYRNDYIIKRKYESIISYFYTLLYLIHNAKKKDIILFYGGGVGIIWTIMVVLISKIINTKIVLELNELPFYIDTSFIINQKRKLFYRIVFPLFNGFIVISEALREVAQKYKSKNASIIKVPIVVETKKIKNIKIIDIGCPYIFHAGSLTESKDGILSALKAFSIAINILQIPLKYVLAGELEESPDKDRIIGLINDNNLIDRVIFTGYLYKEQLNNYLINSSLFILNKNNTCQNRYGFATKLAEYLSSSKAVITTSTGEATYYLHDGINAYIVEPHNPELIAKKIIQAFNNVDERERIAKEGLKLSEKEFNYKYQGERITEFLKKL